MTMLRRMPMFPAMRAKIAAPAVRARVPTIYNQRGFADFGDCMSHGPGIRDAYGRAAVIAGRLAP